MLFRSPVCRRAQSRRATASAHDPSLWNCFGDRALHYTIESISRHHGQANGRKREGILVSGSVKIANNWVATGAARWDLVANQINQYVMGAGYVDDCFVLAANYVTSYSYATATSPPILGHAFMLQLGLRTLANTSTQ